MKFFRHRRPSWKTLLGLTSAKKKVKRDLGITALLKPWRAWGNAKRRIKRRVGYESTVGRLLRNGAPKPGGCVLTLLAMLCLAATTLAAIVTVPQ